jgi:ligand-binding sensor domain-containing protein
MGHFPQAAQTNISKTALCLNMSFVADKSGNVYLTFETDYIFRTTNRGEIWERIKSGFPVGAANGIALDSLGYLWAGSSTGVVRSTDPTPSIPALTVGRQTTGNGIANGDIQIWPNPASGNIHFSLHLQQAGNVQLKLYDLLGSEVAVVVDRHMEAGSHQVPFKVQDHPPGTYHYSLTVDNRVATGRVVVWR